MRSKPLHRLPRQAVNAWRISGFLRSLFFWLVPLGMWLYSLEGEGPTLWMIVFAGCGAFICNLLLTFLIPEIRWKRWRYQVDEHEIDLQHGIFIIRRTLVPVKRVQHVDTRQGPVLRNYGLSSVAISTAATTHEIPALADETADAVRDQISTFARKAKEDV